jgi:NAD-dependent histone deacetylase SIR2
VPAHKIIEAHGSFATQRCIECKTPFDAEKIKKAVLSEKIEIPRCEQSGCRGLVKPDIVFFGEGVCLSFTKSYDVADCWSSSQISSTGLSAICEMQIY